MLPAVPRHLNLCIKPIFYWLLLQWPGCKARSLILESMRRFLMPIFGAPMGPTKFSHIEVFSFRSFILCATKFYFSFRGFLLSATKFFYSFRSFHLSSTKFFSSFKSFLLGSTKFFVSFRSFLLSSLSRTFPVASFVSTWPDQPMSNLPRGLVRMPSVVIFSC